MPSCFQLPDTIPLSATTVRGTVPRSRISAYTLRATLVLSSERRERERRGLRGLGVDRRRRLALDFVRLREHLAEALGPMRDGMVGIRRRLLGTHISYDSTHNVVPPDNEMIKRTNAQYLSLLLRRQPLCFAVSRIFVNCLTHPEAVRESTRRIFDTLSSSSSCPQAGAGAPVGTSVR